MLACDILEIAILIDLLRKEMHMEVCHSTATENQVPKNEGRACPNASFWNPSVLELVELVLRPPQGGPPSLPEQGDAVFYFLMGSCGVCVCVFSVDNSC